MDRLPPLIPAILAAVTIAATACRGEETAEPLTRRVVAVAAKETRGTSLLEFCDVVSNTKPPQKLNLPLLDERGIRERGEFSWINIWATWCKPCIEEIPMLVEWKARLKADGQNVALNFISVDEDIDDLTSFEQSHPAFPHSLHLKQQESLESWIQELGLDKGAGLPVHIFANPENTIRCVRAGAIKKDHYEIVSGLLK